jgi:hypothetical protein
MRQKNSEIFSCMLIPPPVEKKINDASGTAHAESSPQLAIKRTELNRFGNVVAGNFFRAGQIGDGARHFQNAVVGAGAQVQVRQASLKVERVEGFCGFRNFGAFFLLVSAQ